MVAAVARPFASAVAGRLIRVAEDPEAREFVLAYVVDGPRAGDLATGPTEITVPHVWEAGDVDVELAGLRRGTASAAVGRRPGGRAGPGVEYAGRTLISVTASPAAAGETLVVRVRPAAAVATAAGQVLEM